MSVLQIIAIITLVLFGVSALVGGVIIIFIAGKRAARPDALKCSVIIEYAGRSSKPVNGKAFNITTQGITYKFGQNGVVIVPAEYVEKFDHNGRRLIYLDSANQLIASRPSDNDRALTNAGKITLIKSVLFSKLGADMINALGAKASTGIIILVIAFLLGVGAMFAINQAQTIKQKQQQPAPTQSAPAPTIPSNTIIGVE